MPKGTRKPSIAKDGDNLRTALILWGTLADTSWRMFVPVLGLTLVGYLLDGSFQTRPVLMFIGMGLGVVSAVLLIVQQYKGVTKTKEPRK